jgi:hypothetical protein
MITMFLQQVFILHKLPLKPKLDTKTFSLTPWIQSDRAYQMKGRKGAEYDCYSNP